MSTGARALTRGRLLAACLAAVVVICVVDGMTPAGVVVGIFLLLPVIASANSERASDVWKTGALALVGFTAAALFGEGPISPSSVWVPNRVFTTLTLIAGIGGALRMQTLRLRALQARDQALRDRELSLLLHTLLAHELRSPLAMAAQSLEYVRGAAAEGKAADEELLRPVNARLRRGLDAVDQILALALARIEGRDGQRSFSVEEVARALEAEARSFDEEAGVRGGRIDLSREVSADGEITVDLMVLRQSVSLVMGEALRRAGRDPVSVGLSVGRAAVVIEVRTEPPLQTPRLSAELEMFGGVLRSMGGDLTTRRDETSWVLRLHMPAR